MRSGSAADFTAILQRNHSYCAPIA
jgi:hypothetical protein